MNKLSVSFLFLVVAFFSFAKGAPEISMEDLEGKIKTGGVFVVDANGTDKYNAGHIPGAVNVADEKFETLLPKDKAHMIVAYCGGPMCGAWKKAAKKLQAMGYTNVHHFKGGIKNWKEAGKPVEKAS